MAAPVEGTAQNETLITHLEGLTPEILRDDTALASTVRQAIGKLSLKARKEHGGDLTCITLAVTAFIGGENT